MKRVSRGVPTGGQFATDRKSEPAGSLDGWDNGSFGYSDSDETFSEDYIDPSWEAQNNIAPVLSPITNAEPKTPEAETVLAQTKQKLPSVGESASVPKRNAPPTLDPPVRYPDVKQPAIVLRGFVDSNVARGFLTAVNRNTRALSPQAARFACRKELPTISDDVYDELFDATKAHLDELMARGGGGLFGQDWDLLDERIKSAVIVGNGPIDPRYVPPKSVKADGGGYGGNASKGSKYSEAEGKSPAEVGKMIRADIKEAQRAGWIPENVKTSVTRGYSDNFDVSIKGVPRSFYESRATTSNDLTPQSEQAKELRRRVELLANAYGSQDNNAGIDYFNYRRTAHVSYRDMVEDR